MLKRFWPISWAQGPYSLKTIKEHTLTPAVLGDCRHTPRDARWQATPHVAVFFTRAEFLAGLNSAHLLTA